MVNKLVHLDADSETTKESSVVHNDFSLYVGKPLIDAEKLSALETSLERVLDFQSILNMKKQSFNSSNYKLSLCMCLLGF